MRILLETERMILRRLTEVDVDDLYALDADPLVMRFLTNGNPTPYEEIRDETLPNLLAEYDRTGGLGRWAAVQKSTGEFLGWFALRVPAHGPPGEAELGYRLRSSVWGQGYATEGARALVQAAFVSLGLRRVYAQTMAVNLASRRVMEKAGLTFDRVFHLTFDDPIPGTEHGEVEYATYADTHEASAQSPEGSAQTYEGSAQTHEGKA